MMYEGRVQATLEDPCVRSRHVRLAAIICRDRCQLALAIMLSVGVPLFIRSVIHVDLEPEMQFNTITGIIVAICLGYFGFKSINIFPGITSGGYIATSMTVAFAAIASTFLLLRLEYTTVQLFAGYVISTAFFMAVHLFIVGRQVIVMGIIPSDATARLPRVGRVHWLPIGSPDAPLPRLEGVVADLTADHSEAWSNRIAEFALQGVPVYHFKAAIENLVGQVEIDHLSENTLGSLNPNDVYLAFKDAADRSAALLSLFLLGPLFVLVAIAIKLDSPGPVFFKQKRVGFRKSHFSVFKFRTMVHGGVVNDARNSAITIENDPRITRVGRFLRKSRLDELPQMLNVVRGEMSLIGPRPEALPLAEWYEREIPFYHYRHILKPGITGWAQVNQGHVADVAEVTRKLHLDFYYVKNISFWLDVLIVLKTLRVILCGQGAR